MRIIKFSIFPNGEDRKYFTSSKRCLENRYPIFSSPHLRGRLIDSIFRKNQSGDIWAYAIVRGSELATSPSSFHLSLVISLLCMDLARIMDDFSRPLYSWRTPVLGPPDIVANLTERENYPPHFYSDLSTFLFFHAFPFPFLKTSQVDNFLVIRLALGAPSLVNCISMSSRSTKEIRKS